MFLQIGCVMLDCNLTYIVGVLFLYVQVRYYVGYFMV